MTLRIYDTAARAIRDFEPVRPGEASIYICGLTTQGSPHIGHVRFAVAFDILRRWLTIGHNLQVTLVRNVTDIDDKILRKSAENDAQWWAWSYVHERETTEALELLGILPPTYEPRATGHIPEMIEMMQELIDRGHAYAAGDGSGDVYFDVRSYPQYGELTRQSLDDMAEAEDADPRGKRDPRDFALWKGAKADEPTTASWDTPWGRGRPGWHLECSAMARKYLGQSFDIHGGGVDLRFPHHENEIAQSKGCGDEYARYWMHNAWVTVQGEKMSKSLGNSLVVSEIAKHTRPLVLRYYLGAAHYRSQIEYHTGSLDEAEVAVERIEGFLRRALPADAQAAAGSEHIPAEFAAAMDDDLNVSGALAVIFDVVRAGNTAVDSNDVKASRAAALQVLSMCEVLGINPLSEQWATGSSSHEAAMTHALDRVIQAQLEARAAARSSRDFATADRIRDDLTAAGIAVEDTPQGARWSLAEHAESK